MLGGHAGFATLVEQAHLSPAHLALICVAMGAGATDPIYIYAAASPEDGLAQLAEAIRTAPIKPVLIIIDPLFRFVRMKDGNDYAAVTANLLGRTQRALALRWPHLAPAVEKCLSDDGPVIAAAFYNACARHRAWYSDSRCEANPDGFQARFRCRCT